MTTTQKEETVKSAIPAAHITPVRVWLAGLRLLALVRTNDPPDAMPFNL
jgi:hypothetical protein